MSFTGVEYKAIEPFQLQKRNQCFILSNIKFTHDGVANLVGYESDVNKIRKTFEGLNFNVVLEEDKNASEMTEVFGEWSDEDFSDAECVVIFILSHGDEKGVIYGVDSKDVKVDIIQQKFDKTLHGKPKLIFIQACRGSMEPIANIDDEYQCAGPVLTDKRYRDSFVYYSTSEGFYSYVSKVHGTFFISTICDVLKKYSNDYKLSELVTLVNQTVCSNVVELNSGTKIAQASEAVYTLSSDFKFCHFNGGETQQACEDGNVSNPSQSLPTASLEKLYLKRKNHCVLLTNTECGSHKTICERFNEQKTTISKTFSNLNFDVKSCESYKVQKMKDEFKTIQSTDYSEQDCLACIMLGCGPVNDLGALYGSDGKYYSVDTMISTVNKNKSLNGKPKLFFIVINNCDKKSYTHKDDDEHQTAGGGTGGKAKLADTFVYYVVVKDEKECSTFITKLCNVLQQFASKQYHLGEVVLKVNELIRAEELDIIPEICHTLTYEVYFKYAGAGAEAENDSCDSDIQYTLTMPGRAGEDVGNALNYASRGKSLPFVEDDTGYSHETSENIQPRKEPVEDASSEISNQDVTNKSTENIAMGVGDRDLDGKRNIPITQGSNISLCAEDVSNLSLQPIQPLMNQGSSFSRSIETQEIRSQYPSDKDHCKAEPLPSNQGPTLKDLKHNHIDRLKAFLDDEMAVSNWMNLGKAIFQGNKDATANVDNLKRLRYRGGSPGEALLEALSIEQDPTVGEFLQVAKRFRRKDIEKLFANIPGDTHLSDVDERDSQLLGKVAALLDKDMRGIKNWRDFAFAFDCDEEQINQFKDNKVHSSQSPTEGLMALIKAEKPDYALSDLKLKASIVGRNDVAKYIEGVIANLSN